MKANCRVITSTVALCVSLIVCTSVSAEVVLGTQSASLEAHLIDPVGGNKDDAKTISDMILTDVYATAQNGIYYGGARVFSRLDPASYFVELTGSGYSGMQNPPVIRSASALANFSVALNVTSPIGYHLQMTTGGTWMMPGSTATFTGPGVALSGAADVTGILVPGDYVLAGTTQYFTPNDGYNNSYVSVHLTVPEPSAAAGVALIPLIAGALRRDRVRSHV